MSAQLTPSAPVPARPSRTRWRDRLWHGRPGPGRGTSDCGSSRRASGGGARTMPGAISVSESSKSAGSWAISVSDESSTAGGATIVPESGGATGGATIVPDSGGATGGQPAPAVDGEGRGRQRRDHRGRQAAGLAARPGERRRGQPRFNVAEPAELEQQVPGARVFRMLGDRFDRESARGLLGAVPVTGDGALVRGVGRPLPARPLLAARPRRRRRLARRPVFIRQLRPNAVEPVAQLRCRLAAPPDVLLERTGDDPRDRRIEPGHRRPPAAPAVRRSPSARSAWWSRP